MKVTAIIAHHSSRGGEILERCINSIKRDGVEDIIVVSEGNISEARNSGAKIASGDILAFFDDDVELREGCVKELLLPFSDEKVGIVGGCNVNFPDISFEEQISAVLFASPFTMFRSVSRYTPRGGLREVDESEIIGCVMAVRKEAFSCARGFPINCIPNEENYFVTRVQKLGWKVIYNPFAVVYHRRPKVFKEYAKTVFNYGKGRGMWIRQTGTEGRLRIFWKPNKRWVYYALGVTLHYFSYLSGLIYGLIVGENKDGRTKSPNSKS